MMAIRYSMLNECCTQSGQKYCGNYYVEKPTVRTNGPLKKGPRKKAKQKAVSAMA